MKLQVLVDGCAGTKVLAQLRPDVVVALPDAALKESAQRADEIGKLFSERPVAGLIRAAHPLTSGEVVEIAAALLGTEIVIGKSAVCARTLAQNFLKVRTHEVLS